MSECKDVIILGQGARENIIFEKLCQSDYIGNVYVCKNYYYVERIRLDIYAIWGKDIGDGKNVLVFAGSEKFLANPPKFGKHAQNLFPNSTDAMLELSKSYCREEMVRHKIPGVVPYLTLWSDEHGGIFETNVYILTSQVKDMLTRYPVIKPDGLTGGKGVKIVGVDFDVDAAFKYCQELRGSFVLEKFIQGQEFSLMAFCDGINILNTIPIQDHKRLGNGDTGPNTGGMGAISSNDPNGLLPFMTLEDLEKAQDINNRVFNSTKDKAGFGYVGILYGSFIKSDIDGEIYVIEYNARFGDPECINLLTILATDLGQIFCAMADRTLDKVKLEYLPTACVSKYLVPPNYPLPSEPIEIGKIPCEYQNNVYIGDIECGYTNGSRALCVVGCGKTIHDAHLEVESTIKYLQENVTGVSKLKWRSDIGTKYFVNSNDEKISNSNDEKKSILDHDKNEELMTKFSKFLPQTGTFAGSFGLNLLATTDGVGTKTIVAKITNKYENLGKDIVHHCINDLLVQGCMQPLFMLDYIASHDTNVDLVAQIVKTISTECENYGCKLIGGETAEMRDIYQQGMIDIVGMMVGLQTFQLSEVEVGDYVIGFKSNGFHTNGYTLLRSMLTESEIIEYGDYLLQPHKCYLKDVMLNQGIKIKKMCHITGGGFIDNPKRMLSPGTAVTFSSHQIFIDMDQEMSKITKKIGQRLKEKNSQDPLFDINSALLRSFNCGIGFLIVISPEDLFQTINGTLVGRIVDRSTVDSDVVIFK